MDNLDAEIEEYIYLYSEQFQTEQEKLAVKTSSYDKDYLETLTEPLRSAMIKRGYLSNDPAILSMIADGTEALKKRIVDRIWKEHGHELFLNLCPNCQKLARTPKARQCRFCGHDWH